MAKRILVTGTTGFIGKNIKEKLSYQYEMECVTRAEIDLLDDNSVQNFLKLNYFDVIIHAANTNNTRNNLVTPYNVLHNNLRMFFNLEQCKDYYGKMYYFGSGAEYDMEHYIPYMEESYFGTHIPKDLYGFSKYIMSKTCDQLSNIYDLRLFGVYGKYEEWERRFISNAICRALKGMDITIQKNVYFDYLWIDDLCTIMEWFINNEPKHKHYNVCRGNRIDLYSLACMVKEELNIDCNIVIKEKGWKPEYTGNNDRLLREMGNFRFTDYRESIEKLCSYYKENIDSIDKQKLI